MDELETVVVPIDFTARDERSLSVAAGLADGASIRLLHVIPATAAGPVADVTALYQRLAAQVNARLPELTAELTDRDVDFHVDIWLGDETEETLRFLADLGPRTLLVLSHPAGDQEDRADTLFPLVRRAPCSVLMVR